MSDAVADRPAPHRWWRGSGALGRVGLALLRSTSVQLARHVPCPIVVVSPSAST